MLSTAVSSRSCTLRLPPVAAPRTVTPLSSFPCTHLQLHADAQAACSDLPAHDRLLTVVACSAVPLSLSALSASATFLCLASHRRPLASLQSQRASMSTPASRARMVKEAAMLETQPPPQCTAWRIHEQINHWHARQSQATAQTQRTQTDRVSEWQQIASAHDYLPFFVV